MAPSSAPTASDSPRTSKGHWEKIPQSGPVLLGNRVDVQANACIDRATVGATEIGDGSKVDNLVQVGHGSGRPGYAGLRADRARRLLGDRQQRHPRRPDRHRRPLHVGDGVILTAQSAVSHDVPPGKMISGSPGFDNRVWLRAVTIFQRLPELLNGSIGWKRRLARPLHLKQIEKRLLNELWLVCREIPLLFPAPSALGRAGGSALFTAGCHSYHVETTVENHTGEPVKLIEVDYPSASFGADSLAAGADFHYRIQLRGSGPLKVQFTGADGHQAQVTGPTVAERQEGSLQIVLLPGGKAEFHPQLSPATISGQ